MKTKKKITNYELAILALETNLNCPMTAKEIVADIEQHTGIVISRESIIPTLIHNSINTIAFKTNTKNRNTFIIVDKKPQRFQLIGFSLSNYELIKVVSKRLRNIKYDF